MSKQVIWLVAADAGVLLARVALTGPSLTRRTDTVLQPVSGMKA